MIDFRTKKTRTILVLSIIYILLLPLILAFNTASDVSCKNSSDAGFDSLGVCIKGSLVLGLKNVSVFFRFYTDSTTYMGTDELFAYIYLAPLFFYWIVFPVLRTSGRWVNRGK